MMLRKNAPKPRSETTDCGTTPSDQREPSAEATGSQAVTEHDAAHDAAHEAAMAAADADLAALHASIKKRQQQGVDLSDAPIEGKNVDEFFTVETDQAGDVSEYFDRPESPGSQARSEDPAIQIAFLIQQNLQQETRIGELLARLDGDGPAAAAPSSAVDSDSRARLTRALVRLKAYHGALKQAREIIGRQKQALLAKKAVVASLQKKLANAHAEHDEDRVKIRQLDHELADVRQQSATLAQKLGQAEPKVAEARSLRCKLQEADRRNSEMQDQVRDSQQRHQAVLIEKRELEARLATQQQELSQMIERDGRLQAKLRESAVQSTALDNLRAEIVRLETDLSSLEPLRDELQAESRKAQQADARARELQSSNAALLESLQTLEKDKRELLGELAMLRDAVQAQRDAVRQRDEALQRLERQEKAYQVTVAETDQVRAELQKRDSRNASLKADIGRLENALARRDGRAREDLNALAAAEHSLKSLLGQQDAAMRDLQSERNGLVTRMAELQARLERAESRNVELLQRSLDVASGRQRGGNVIQLVATNDASPARLADATAATGESVNNADAIVVTTAACGATQESAKGSAGETARRTARETVQGSAGTGTRAAANGTTQGSARSTVRGVAKSADRGRKMGAAKRTAAASAATVSSQTGTKASAAKQARRGKRSAETASRSVPRDDLTELEGLGATSAALLVKQGIRSFEALAAFDPEAPGRLAKPLAPLLSRLRRHDWVGQARARLNGTGRARKAA